MTFWAANRITEALANSQPVLYPAGQYYENIVWWGGLHYNSGIGNFERRSTLSQRIAQCFSDLMSVPPIDAAADLFFAIAGGGPCGSKSELKNLAQNEWLADDATRRECVLETRPAHRTQSERGRHLFAREISSARSCLAVWSRNIDPRGFSKLAPAAGLVA